MSTYETSTFLVGLFCKFHLYDRTIRKKITTLYKELIDSILNEASEEKRILIFKSLVPIIKDTIDYFLSIKESKTTKKNDLMPIVIKLIAHSTYIMQKIGIKDNEGARVFDDIMKQVFIDEIACDIGECIGEYKKTTQTKRKSEIIDRLKVLLADFNVVEHTKLTPADVLEPKEDE